MSKKIVSLLMQFSMGANLLYGRRRISLEQVIGWNLESAKTGNQLDFRK